MKSTFLKVMPWVFEEEGGYVDHPKDPGGATNLGITHKTLSAWRGRPVTKQDVKNLTRQEAQNIYKSEYWNQVRGDRLPAGLDYVTLDYGINSGPSRAVRELQKIVGVNPDGIVGSQTTTAIQKFSVAKLIDLYCDARIKYLRSLKTFKTFGKGWLARVERVRKRSKSLVGNSPLEVPKASPQTPVKEIEAIPSPKAREEDESLIHKLKKPESWGPLTGLLSGFSGFVAESGPIQWALGLAMFVGIGIGLYYFIKKERSGA